MKRITALLLLILGGVVASGQTNRGAIRGTVTDTTGAAIPGAKITVRNKATSETVEASTDESGNFRVSSLLPATYEVQISREGFSSETRTNVVLNVEQVLELDPTLKPGATSETVQVDTTPTPLDTASATIGEVVPGRAIEGLPLNVRDTFALVGLTPGVQFGGNFGNGGSTDVGRGFYRNDFDIGGGRSGFQEIFIDGAPNTTGDRGLNIIDPPVDSVQEFKVQANSYDAQFGRTTGGVVNMVTKSGSNKFHGTAYFFERQRIFDANQFFNKHDPDPTKRKQRQPFARHQFGGNLGGPLWREKLFFFVDYEGLRQGYPITQTSIVPTAAQRTGDFSSSGANIFDPATTTQVGGVYSRQQFSGNVIPANRIDPVAAKVIALYPLPNATGNGYNYIYSAKSITNSDRYDVRIDTNLDTKTRLFGRYSRQQDRRIGVGKFPSVIGGGRSVEDHFTQAVLDLNRTFTSKTVADLAFSFGRAYGAQLGLSDGFDQTSIGLPASLASQLANQFPVMNIADITGTSNGSDAIVSVQPRNIWALIGTVYHQMGRHSLKFGGDWRNIFFNEGQNSQPAGVYNFTRDYTRGFTTPTGSPATNKLDTSSNSGFGVASFLLGDAASGSVIRNNRLSTHGQYYAAFIQDDWRVTDRLTLNLGLRYDVSLGDSEKYNKLAWFDPNAPSPIAGAAGLPNLKGVIRWTGQGNDKNQQSTDWKNIGPRFGFAFHAHPRMVVRGGYGIFWHPRIIAGTNGGAIEAVRSTTMNATTDGGLTPADRLSNPYPQGTLAPINDRDPLANLGQSLTIPTHDNFKNGYSQLYSLGIQQDLGWGLVLDIHGWGNKSTHIANQYNLNQLPTQYLSQGAALTDKVPNPFYGIITTGALASPTVSRQQLLLPFPQYQGISLVYAPFAGSTFNALTVQVDKRISSVFTLLANYTWSKALDDVRTPLNTYDPHAEKSYSPFHIPNQAHISWVFAIPFGADRHWGRTAPRAVTAILGDWDFSQITNLQTGLPVSIARPATIAAGRSARLANPTIDKWFDTSIFSTVSTTPPNPGQFGNVGPYLRDVTTQSIHNVDAVLSKNFTVVPGEHKVTGTFRAEAYNLTNTHQFGFPSNNPASPATFGKVTSTLNNPRQLQFAVKLRF